MNITYKFILQGQSYIIPEKKDEVVLDVGGQNQGFIFDHHFPNSPEDCAAKIVFNNSNRLKELKDSKNVTIVIHNDPDFDCSCAAWLVKNYLEENCSNGRLFPKDAEWVVQYASLVDSGKLKINSKHVLTPATAIFAFYELSLKKIKDREIDANDKNEWILYRTFDLLNWCVNKLTDINIDNYENIDDKSISDRMIQSEKFGMEHQILEEDRPIFESELLDKSICQTIKDFKLFNHQKTVEKVSALIYFRPSRSSLVKYWARNDGYIFTLIPKNCDGKWDNAIWKPPGFSGRPNRVIISVPPDSNYNLKTLAIQLERTECEFERRILGDAAELKRTRTVVRNGYENEKWVTNSDPWFDGNSFKYTIVDSPSSLSLLSTEKIIEVASSFTEKDVTNAQIKIIYPVILKDDNKFRDDSWECFFNENNSSNKYKSATWIPIKEVSNYNLYPENLFLFDDAKKLLWNKENLFSFSSSNFYFDDNSVKCKYGAIKKEKSEVFLINSLILLEYGKKKQKLGHCGIRMSIILL